MLCSKCLTTKSYKRILGVAREDDFQSPGSSRHQAIETESKRVTSKTVREQLDLETVRPRVPNQVFETVRLDRAIAPWGGVSPFGGRSMQEGASQKGLSAAPAGQTVSSSSADRDRTGRISTHTESRRPPPAWSFRASSRPPASTRSTRSNGNCATRSSATKRAPLCSNNAGSRCRSPGRSRRPTSLSQNISGGTSDRPSANARSSS